MGEPHNHIADQSHVRAECSKLRKDRLLLPGSEKLQAGTAAGLGLLTLAARQDSVVHHGKVLPREQEALGGGGVQRHGRHAMQLGEDAPAAGGRQHVHDLAVAHQGRLIVPLQLHSRPSISTHAHGAQRCGIILLARWSAMRKRNASTEVSKGI